VPSGDDLRDLAEIIVELMVTARQQVAVSLGDRAGVQVNVIRRRY
jgi:hypothetical protein